MINQGIRKRCPLCGKVRTARSDGFLSLFNQRRKRQTPRSITLCAVKADERTGIQAAVDLQNLRRIGQIKANG